jgi:hypothetical protein
VKNEIHKYYSTGSRLLFCIALTGVIYLTAPYLLYGQTIVPDYNWSKRELPPGVPREVDTNGNIFYLDISFTSIRYQKYACDFLLKEANVVAQELKLNEDCPITTSNLVGGYIPPFGFAYAYRRLGNISTSNYVYGVECDFKLSDVTITKIDDRCRDYKQKYQWPLNLFNTNAPYQLATQWLEAVHMDVARLNQDYEVHVDLDPYWNDVQMGELPGIVSFSNYF